MSEMGGPSDAVHQAFDVVIIGAGVSGINAAHRVQTQLPNLTYTILESRGDLGGTWNLFKYPGIRSDSDLYTFGFPWRLWSSERAIADGPSILKYLKDSVQEYGIDKKIQYNHSLLAADWSSKMKLWALEVASGDEKVTITTRFIIYGSGYYDYDEPLQTTIPGIEAFRGTAIHPQFWPENLDYTGKKIVIIGSGATAITLLPVLAETASSVTMLQRSPTYILATPAAHSGGWIRHLLPSLLAHQLIRWQFMWGMFLYYKFCRAFPVLATLLIKKATEKELPGHIKQDPNFKPAYNPWEQRLCVCPDGDFYRALRQKNASVVTDLIQNVTESGIQTIGGTFLDADVIITATGLKMKFAGGTKITLDGSPIDISQKYMWKGTLLQDVPNTAFLLGYTNASWTLGAEASTQLVCRILRRLNRTGMEVVTPKVKDETRLRAEPVLNLSSTYIKKGGDVMPKAGDRGPWLPKRSYFKDFLNARYGRITDELEFS